MLLAMLAGAIGIPRHHHNGIAPTPHDVDKMLDRMDRALGRIAALEADNKELKSEVETLMKQQLGDTLGCVDRWVAFSAKEAVCCGGSDGPIRACPPAILVRGVIDAANCGGRRW